MPKNKIKDFIGPVELEPSITKQSTVDGKINTDITGGDLGIKTRFGNINLNKTDITESTAGSPDFTTKQKSIGYNKVFNLDDSSSIEVSLNKGKAKTPMGKSDTQGGKISYRKVLGKPKSGAKAKGGMVNYDKSLVKGGFTKKYYKGLI